MLSVLKRAFTRLLVWSQKYTRTDMRYVAHGGFWMSLNLVLSSAVSVALAIVFANLLPKEVYGYYKYVLSIGSLFGFLTFTGMNAAVSQAVARGQDGAFPYAVRIQLKWNLLLTVVLTGVGIYYLLNGSQKLGVPLLFLAIGSPLAAAYTTYGAYLGGKKDFKTASQYSTAAAVLYALFMCAAVLITKDVRWLAATYAVSSAATAFLFHRLTMRKYKPEGLEEEERIKMLTLGKHLSLTNVLGSLAQYVDSIVVFKFGDATELAIYAFANVIPDRLRGFMKRALGIVAPKIATKTAEEARKSLGLRVLQGLVVGAALAAIYWLLSPFVFKYIFPQYVVSTFYSQLIALGFLIVIPATYSAQVMQAQHLYTPLYVGTTISNLFRIFAIIAGGYFGGALGVIVARLVANLFATTLVLLLINRDLRKLPAA